MDIMKNGVRLLATLLGVILVLAIVPTISVAAAGRVSLPLTTENSVLVADENTAMITTFEQDPVSKMITANVQLQQNGTEDVEISILGIAIYFDGNRVAPYSYNDNSSVPACFTGRIDSDTNKDDLSQVFGAYFKKNTASGFRFESNQLIQNEPDSTIYPDSFINIMLNHTNSNGDLSERIIHAGEKLDIAKFYFMPIKENDSKLDLNMFKFKFSRDYWNFIRATNFLGKGTYVLEASSLGIDLNIYTVALKPQAFRIHVQHLPPVVEANGRQIEGYDTATMQWSYDGSAYKDGAPELKRESHEIFVRAKGDSGYGGDDGLYTGYKKYIASEAIIFEFEATQSNPPTVNHVIEGDKEITGKGESGSDIIVTFPNGKTGETKVGEDGNWTVKVPDGLTLAPNEEIKVVQKEEGLKLSDPVTVFVTGKDASVVPTVNDVTEGDKEITGTGESGSEIIVTFPDGETEKAIVGDDGNWKVEVPDDVTLEPGDEIIVVQIEDGKNPSAPVTVEVQGKEASVIPTVNDVTEGDKEITGKGESGSEIVVTFPDGETEKAIVDDDGNWTVDVPDDVTLEEGDEIKVVQVEDGKAPSEPVVVVVKGKDESGKPEVNPVTEGDTEITGKGEPGSEIVVTFPDGTTEEAIVDDDGNWTVDVPDDVTLEPGDEITVVQVEDGKAPSEPVVVVVKGKDESGKPEVNPVTEGDTEITGKGEPGSEIVVTFPDGETEKAIVDDDGNWTVEVPDDVTLEEGDEITVVQVEDGKAPSEPVVVVVKEKEEPTRNRSEQPIVNTVTEGDMTVKGEGVPGATVTVGFRGGKTVFTRVNGSGKWSVDVPDGVLLEVGHTVIAWQTENGKDDSNPVTMDIQARQQSGSPTVDPVTEGDDEITGTGEPGSEIIVTFPDGETETVIVDEDGNWKVVIPDDVTLNPGDEIEVVQVEDGKKPSDKVVIKVDSKPNQTQSNGSRTQVIDDVEIPLRYLEKGEHRIYIVGYTDKTVRADKSITRAEVAMIFYRLLQTGYQGGNTGPSFKDVSNGAWYSQAVRTLAQLGIIQGYDDGTFRPNDPITRAEFAVIAARFDDLEFVSGVAFTDVAMSHWAVDSIQSAYAKGWVNGYGSGEFRPEQNITRAEVAKIIDTMLMRLPEELPDNLINPYSDINSAHGAFINIMEASTEHTFSRDDDGIEIWMAHICPITGKELVHIQDTELF